MPGPELQIVSNPPAERADAARNRRKILRSAEQLLREEGFEALTMDRVAAAAGVGVGTVYRRFGDRSGLAYAMVDDLEQQFQQSFLHGEPPLGPGAPTGTRIRAFLEVLVKRADAHRNLLLIAETSAPMARFTTGAYYVHRTHLATLIRAARPELDAEYLANALLAATGVELVVHQLRDLGMTRDRILAGIDALVTGLGL